jgi:hypothetical protein
MTLLTLGWQQGERKKTHATFAIKHSRGQMWFKGIGIPFTSIGVQAKRSQDDGLAHAVRIQSLNALVVSHVTTVGKEELSATQDRQL